jgi:signal transduction histidine kinase/DNA-binding response OmpR family regulator
MNLYLGGQQNLPKFSMMEENRTRLRRFTQRLIALIYLLVISLSIGAYYLITDLEKSGVVRDTKTERGLATILLLGIWTIICYRLYKLNTQNFDRRSEIFDAREAEHYAILEAAQLQEQFMANMSHEIRTPLNAIIGFGNVLTKSDLGERERELVSNIQVASENLLVIVNDILDLSKIESGMLVLEHVIFYPRAVLFSLQQMFADKALQKKLSIDIHLAPTVPEQLVGDPTRFSQILINLINNAIKFTERGGVVVSVVPTETASNERITLRIEVRDTGIGIPENQMERIFERFTQSDENTTRLYGGTGLGLSIVRQLLKAMGGSIILQSDEGKGSVFIVMVPFDLKPGKNAVLSDLLPPKAVRAVYKAPHLPDVKILVAEDNPMNRRVVELLFTEWGYQFTSVKNGREAYDLLASKSHEFNLVFMDIQMPEMDGYTATQQIRHKLGLKIPIVAMTANALAGERDKCLSFGMDDYLAKPILEEELGTIIARFAQKTPAPELEIDFQNLSETTLGNLEHQNELAQIFLTQVPKDLAAIAAALSSKNLLAAAQAAHNMKSTVGYMGFSGNLGAQLTEFERLCKEEKDINLLNIHFEGIKKNGEKAIALIHTTFSHSV